MTGALTRAGDAGGCEHEKGLILLPGGFQKSWQHAIESQRSVTAMYRSQYAVKVRPAGYDLCNLFTAFTNMRASA